MNSHGQYASSSSFPSSQPSRLGAVHPYSLGPRPLESHDSRSGSERKRRHTGASPGRRYNPHQYFVAGPNPSQTSILNDNSSWNNAVRLPLSEAAAGMARVQSTDYTSFLNFLDGTGEELHQQNTTPSIKLSDNVPPWQPDATASNCRCCRAEFSFWLRRHHCRRCGHVVCATCSPHRILIPKQSIVQDPSRLDTESSINPASLTGGATVRVCRLCVPRETVSSSSHNQATGRATVTEPVTTQGDQQLASTNDDLTSLNASNSASRSRETNQHQAAEGDPRAPLPPVPENLPTTSAPPASSPHQQQQQQPPTSSAAASRLYPQPRYASFHETGIFNMDESRNRPNLARSQTHTRSASSSTRGTHFSVPSPTFPPSANPASASHMTGSRPETQKHAYQPIQAMTQPTERMGDMEQLALGQSYVFPPPVTRHVDRPPLSTSQPVGNHPAPPNFSNHGRNLLLSLPAVSNSQSNPFLSPPGVSNYQQNPYSPPPGLRTPQEASLRQNASTITAAVTRSTYAAGDSTYSQRLHQQRQQPLPPWERPSRTDVAPHTDQDRQPRTPSQVYRGSPEHAHQQNHQEPHGHAADAFIPQHQRIVREGYQCPVCDTNLPADEQLRERHVDYCVKHRYFPPSSQASPAGQIPSFTHRCGMAVSKATPRDCTASDGTPKECIICLDEYEVGKDVARLECLCLFHFACISWYWKGAERGPCPTHKRNV